MEPEKKYEIFFTGSARKEIKKLGHSAAAEIFRQITKKLTTKPTEYGEALHGDLAGYLKLRVSGFRVVYKVIEERVWVLVVAAGKRNEGNVDNIYDWLTGDMLSERTAQLIKQIEAAQRKKTE